MWPNLTYRKKLQLTSHHYNPWTIDICANTQFVHLVESELFMSLCLFYIWARLHRHLRTYCVYSAEPETCSILSAFHSSGETLLENSYGRKEGVFNGQQDRQNASFKCLTVCKITPLLSDDSNISFVRRKVCRSQLDAKPSPTTKTSPQRRHPNVMNLQRILELTR